MRPERESQIESRALYEYPEHLKPEIASLPRAPGVYTFHGPDGAAVLPLYIGKSIDIRGRVMDHLRTPAEARLLRQSRTITHIRTAGDVGAQLLEAKLIKTSSPLYNRKLRRITRQFSILFDGQKVSIGHSAEIDPALEPHTYGLYTSKQSATSSLRRLADENRLCYSLVGLERLPAGRPCFRSMLKQCAGACRGSETVDEHHGRLLWALQQRQVVSWPFAGAIALEEQGEDMRQFHVVRDWRYIGSTSTLSQARRLRAPAGEFDRDAYRILAKPILEISHPVHRLES